MIDDKKIKITFRVSGSLKTLCKAANINTDPIRSEAAILADIKKEFEGEFDGGTEGVELNSLEMEIVND